MQDLSTPMMKQYLAIKAEYPDCLLFFRLGDFYELFLDDAETGAKVLNITLTSRPTGKDRRIPMAGVPYHAVDIYLSKLVKAGYKVAICEQVSLPNKYGIVEREVIRIVTPGTVMDESSLSKKDNNYILSLTVKGQTLAMAIADISTGYFAVTEKQFDDLDQTLQDEMARLHPVECILSSANYQDVGLLKVLRSEKGLNIYPFLEWDKFAHKSTEFLKQRFNVVSLASFDIPMNPLVLESAAALLGYLELTQKTQVGHIQKLATFGDRQHLALDRATIINLELFTTIREHDTKGTLLSVIDQTLTPMGGRLLKQWLNKPLAQESTILNRLDVVQLFLDKSTLRDNLRQKLKEVPDIERLLARISLGLGNARDLINLKNALVMVLAIKTDLPKVSLKLIREIDRELSPKVQKVVDLINRQIMPEPPIDLRIGGLINNGINSELDKLRQTVSQSRSWLLELEQTERIRTGISSLKVRFNKVFGFYIEVSKSNLHLIPENYLRKQTLVNGERYITPELKQHEEIILTAEQTINDLEYRLFLEVVAKVLNDVHFIQSSASAISTLDCLTNFSFLAQANRYTRPNLIKAGQIKIKAGRHPVVEQLLEGRKFVPNDVTLDRKSEQLLLITGPNMAGKSVYIRQLALIVLMAQIGCYVPADKADITVVDQIFVRSGASDVITSGLSTFMVEMVETAYILNNATDKSLIVMDEIGRGTSTYDGISIAWAVAEFLILNSKLRPKTLFATHYHELQQLEVSYPDRIKNYSMGVSEEDSNLNFLHTVLPGGASHSFGVAVAKLAGIPKPVLEQAYQKLAELERRDDGGRVEDQKANIALVQELASLDIHQLTPLQALNKLSELKDKLIS